MLCDSDLPAHNSTSSLLLKNNIFHIKLTNNNLSSIYTEGSKGDVSTNGNVSRCDVKAMEENLIIKHVQIVKDT